MYSVCITDTFCERYGEMNITHPPPRICQHKEEIYMEIRVESCCIMVEMA